MAANQWMTLLEYSTKYGVSLSTLRRRIKDQSVPYRQDGGKYFLPDQELIEAKDLNEATPTNVSAASERKTGGSTRASRSESNLSPAVSLQQSNFNAQQALQSQIAAAIEAMNLPQNNTSSYVEATVLSSANRLVEELKAAYAKILQEKEEQIAQLREEVVDLRTLVKVLEDQVSRVRSPLSFSFEDFSNADQ